MFGILPLGNYCLKYIYFYNSDQCLFNKIGIKINKYEIMDIKMIDKNFILDFTQGKDYNVKQVNDLFNNISNPSVSDTKLKKEIISMLGSFEFSYGKYLSDVASIFKRMDDINKEK
jgi:hypothetical protein